MIGIQRFCHSGLAHGGRRGCATADAVCRDRRMWRGRHERRLGRSYIIPITIIISIIGPAAPASAPVQENALPPAPLPAPLPDRSGAHDDAHLIALWLAGGSSVHTQRAYARDVAACRAWTGERPLAALTLADLQGWREHLQAQGQSAAASTGAWPPCAAC